jgi:hypothetical protein
LVLGIYWIAATPEAEGFNRYQDGCNDAGCHGDFPSDVSPKGTEFPNGGKHGMHRNAGDMNTDCNLCHTSSDNRNPWIGSSDGTANNPGLGCTGCHEGTGLRLHHVNNGLGFCADCHTGDPSPPPEDTVPPYYGTADTNADNPCNSVADENWSIGDFLGLDNDGDNLYDGDDPDCTPDLCGNGTVDDGEDCDDGNNLPGDCCAADCTYETSDTLCGNPGDLICDLQDTCDGSGTCVDNVEPTSMSCRNSAGECDPAEFCDGAGSCPADAFEPNGTACGDSSDTSCDNPDTCMAGECMANYEVAGTPCSDGAFCNGDELCDGAGTCDPGTAVVCDDSVSCTDDSCDEASDACVYAPNDANCDDGAFCNGSETCHAVNDCQAGTPVDCADGVDCTNDSCNEGTDSCDNLPDNANCDDGTFCNGAETCHAVNDCQAGTPVDCSDTRNADRLLRRRRLHRRFVQRSHRQLRQHAQ